MKIITTEQIISSFIKYWGGKFDYSITVYRRGKPVDIHLQTSWAFLRRKTVGAYARQKWGLSEMLGRAKCSSHSQEESVITTRIYSTVF